MPPKPPPARRLRAPVGGGGLGLASTEFFDALCRTWGLSASTYRGSILARRQAACLRALRAASPADGIRALARSPAAAERALGSLLIGVTEFFRDPSVFGTLRPLLRPLRTEGAGLHALSLGCSDGSELYSLGMLLAEEGLLSDARLLGMDGRPAAIAAARAGVYPAAAADCVPGALRERYFVPDRCRAAPERRSRTVADCLRVTEPLRAACRWVAADAFSLAGSSTAEAAPDDAFDVILCRNLAIYLTPDAAARLWALCVSRLRSGGLLVTGKAERPPADGRSGLHRVAACIYRRN